MSAITQQAMGQMWRMLPPDILESVTLKKRTAGPPDTFVDTVYAHAQRRDADLQTLALLMADVTSQTWCIFELYQDGETVAPVALDKLTDAVGVTWAIKKVGTDYIKRIHLCYCLKQVS